jgi:hypothetical protein
VVDRCGWTPLHEKALTTHGYRSFEPSAFAARFDEDGSRPRLNLANPYADAELQADFTHAESGATLSPHGFYDSAGVFRVRFAPPREGAWSWTVRSPVVELHGHAGTLQATVAQGDTVILHCH